MVEGSHTDSARVMTSGEPFQLLVHLSQLPPCIYCSFGRKQGVSKCSSVKTVGHTHTWKKNPINKGNQKNLLLLFLKNRICNNRNIFQQRHQKLIHQKENSAQQTAAIKSRLGSLYAVFISIRSCLVHEVQEAQPLTWRPQIRRTSQPCFSAHSFSYLLSISGCGFFSLLAFGVLLGFSVLVWVFYYFVFCLFVFKVSIRVVAEKCFHYHAVLDFLQQGKARKQSVRLYVNSHLNWI